MLFHLSVLGMDNLEVGIGFQVDSFYFYLQKYFMMIKAIFLDVDGTILSFSTHQIPVSAQNALLQLHDKGYKIIIATGRSAGDLAEISSVPYQGVVGLNGAECTLRNGEVIARCSIPLELFRKSLELAEKYDFAVAVEGDDGIYVNKLSPRVVEMSRLVDHPLPQVRDLNEVFKEGVSSQLCFFFDREIEQKVMTLLPGLTATRWCDVFADINVVGVNKAAGICSFADYLGIELSETMALGDGGNDIPMLRVAGIGVAMGNASDEVKSHADYVTDHIDNDGLFKVFKHFELI